MRQVNIHSAKTHLSRLIDEALAGEAIIIARRGKALVRLTPIEASGQRRTLGKDQGKIVMADDFDAPMPEFEALIYGGAVHPADPA